MRVDRDLWVNHRIAQQKGINDRQVDILCGLAEGKSNEAIGKDVWLAPDSVKYHVRGLTRLLGAASRAHVVAIAYDEGLLRTRCEREWLAEQQRAVS